MSTALQPGLLALHGNRLEELADLTLDWLRRHPLRPLEEEHLLVQSNGMGEWLKMRRAETLGVCAATRIDLPARFVWRCYRAVLGRDAVPAVSPLDRRPLVWRLMALLPRLQAEPGFEPVARFLGAGADATRRLQLAERLADLFDQYQVYRGDWLACWAEGRDELIGFSGQAEPLAADQRWQASLWRALLAALGAEGRDAIRPTLHRLFLQALADAEPGSVRGLPRRVVLFGTTHIPLQTLEAVAALSRHLPVLMAVPNPCRFHWSDIVQGRDLLRAAAARRHPLRAGIDLSAVPAEALHAHGHPLLAAWGRQSRDFVRQLDAFDETQRTRERFEMPRVDLFDDSTDGSMLQRVQARIRDLVPLGEQVEPALAPGDRSIVFHVAHSAQREVEVLHDQLLQRLAEPSADGPLAPRDIVVMVPDIERFAPAIRAVFGQYRPGDRRHIPWGIADQRDRGHHPMLLAVEWLLGAPTCRFTAGELRELLEVPAVARRFGFTEDDLHTLFHWVEGAGIRWGLHARQRDGLGLGACGDDTSWRFGLRRMLLGYAAGELAEPHRGIEPYAEIGGLSARLAGSLAECVDRLDDWWRDSVPARSPEVWGERLRRLLDDFLQAGDDDERAVVAALSQGLGEWLHACEAAGFDEPVDLAVAREAWLESVDAPGESRRFKAGGVTFCTLLPMRAIPFEVVCLLGLNDGDYPRRQPRSDFDLMALPGQARAGDRSRRDDDRQLMLDALLSARRALHVSWAGRSVRDNQPQPPSVLVSQLRDYLAAAFGQEALEQRTTVHPLQPFSRRYFEQPRPGASGDALFTYAVQWRSAHDAREAAETPAEGAPVDAGPKPGGEGRVFTLQALVRFLQNPVREFFRERLQVRFDDLPESAPDDEAFGVEGLQQWKIVDGLIRELTEPQGGRDRLPEPGFEDEPDPSGGALGEPPPQAIPDRAAYAVDRLAGRGLLPLAGPGLVQRKRLSAQLATLLAAWQEALDGHAVALPPLHCSVPGAGATQLDDWLEGLRAASLDGPPMWIRAQASKACRSAKGKVGPASPRVDKLLDAWLASLASAAAGRACGGIVIAPDARLLIDPIEDAESARQTLLDLMQAATEGLAGSRPLPTAVQTGLAALESADKAAGAYTSDAFKRGEGEEACLARCYPDAQALLSEPDFEPASQRLYGAFAEWAKSHVHVEAIGPVEAGGPDAGSEDADA